MVLTGSCYRIITFRGFVLKVSGFCFISWMNFGLPGGPNAAPSADRGLCRRERRGVRNHLQISQILKSRSPDGRQRGLTCGGAGGTCPLCCRRCPFRARDAPVGNPRRTLGKCLGGGSTCSCPWGWRSRVGVRDPRCRKESGRCSPTSGTNVSEAVSHICSPCNQPHGGCCLATRGSILL